DRDDARPAERFSDRKFGDKKPYTPREGGGEKRPYTPRGEGFRKDGDRPRGDRPFSARPSRDGDRPRGDRPERKFGGDKKFSRGAPDRGPRKNFAERPGFGDLGAYRERQLDFDKRAPQPPRVKKSGERIAKVVSRAGLASRRDAEEWITQSRVTVNGRVINSPALDVTANDVIAVDGKVLPPRERTRLFMYHKPRGLMTTHADPEGR